MKGENHADRPHAVDPLTLDGGSTIREITSFLQHAIHRTLRRHGIVIAVSGGLDSAVCSALCVRALGPAGVLLLSLPERHSSPDSRRLPALLAESLGVKLITEDVSPVLEALGAYQRQQEALREIFPDCAPTWKFKIVLPPLRDGERLSLPRVTVELPSGEQRTQRIDVAPYRRLIAATNFKQRVRTMVAYYHAETRAYALCGTANRLEYELGFFVRGGDGLSDVMPIAHLYKSQVRHLGRELGVPPEILDRTPTTDTFSLEQTQEEFFFAAPLHELDWCLFGLNTGMPASDVARKAGLEENVVERVYRDIRSKRHSGDILQLPPLSLLHGGGPTP